MSDDTSTGGSEHLDESWHPIGASTDHTGNNWQILFARRMSDGSWEYRVETYKPMSIDRLIGSNATEDTDTDTEGGDSGDE